MGWTEDLPGVKGIKLEGGTPLVPRNTLRLLGNARVLDNPSAGTTDVTIEDTLSWVYAAPAANQSNYLLTGFNRATDIGLSPSDDIEIDGFALEGGSGAVYVPVKRIWRFTDNDILLKHQTGSLAENQLITPDGADLDIPLNGFVMMVRDPVKRAWRCCKLLGS